MVFVIFRTLRDFKNAGLKVSKSEELEVQDLDDIEEEDEAGTHLD
jgi:hypothetical protein